MARIANLPVHIRNSNGVGGGQVVGWLPVVCDVFYNPNCCVNCRVDR